MVRSEKLRRLRQAFGGLVYLDYSGLSWVEAHRGLGEEVGSQARKILLKKLDELGAEGLARKLGQARTCRDLLLERQKDARLKAEIRQAISEYLDCLEAWANGAGLGKFSHPLLAGGVGGRPITSTDLALVLQHDNVGCQTGMYRCANGSLVFWHSEEDAAGPGERFDKLRIAKMVLPDSETTVESQMFIYPDLLPGPAFAWRSDGYIQAADTLNLMSQPELEQGALVNVVCWLALRLGPRGSLEEIVQALLPYWDGYALNVAYPRKAAPAEDKLVALKIEYARRQVIRYQLDDQPGSFLFQVNLFCQRRNATVKAIEALPVYRQRFNAQRIYRTRRMLRKRKMDGLSKREAGVPDFVYHFGPEVAQETANSTPDEVNFIYSMLGSRLGGDGAYANEDVRAWMIAHLSDEALSVWTGAGAVI